MTVAKPVVPQAPAGVVVPITSPPASAELSPWMVLSLDGLRIVEVVVAGVVNVVVARTVEVVVAGMVVVVVA